MSSELIGKFRDALGECFPSILSRLKDGDDMYRAIEGGLQALEQGSLSWAQLNQIMHRSSEAGMSEGFFRYYFLDTPDEHPYPADLVLSSSSYRPPAGGDEILSIQQLQWGIRRFMYDAMLYWGNFRQAYRELRQRKFEEIEGFFASKRVDEERMIRRGKVLEPTSIPRDHRYLISEMACKTYAVTSLGETPHVKIALEAFRGLQSEGKEITPAGLKVRAEAIASFCRETCEKARDY